MTRSQGDTKTNNVPLGQMSEDGRVVFDGKGADISATKIYELLMGIGSASTPSKITVRNATIVGRLNLECAELATAAKFLHCVFNEKINLEQVKAKAFYFVECDLRGIAAAQLQTTFSFVLHKCRDVGGINLAGAHIGGQVSFEATRLCPLDGAAMTADGLVVDQDMRCSNGFVAKGCVRLIGAHISGQFQCDNGSFLVPGRVALQANGLLVDEHVYWPNGFRADGAIRLRGAHIKGELHCEGGQFTNPGHTTLDFQGLTVDQDVTLTAGTVVSGGIDLTGSHIGGKLDLTGGAFHNAGTTALDLARAVIAQNMICRSGFDVQGKILLAGAQVSGNLWCEGGRFDNATDIAIDGTGLTVGRDVAFSRQAGGEGFLANGKVVLSDANIGGSLCCTGGQFTNPGGIALTAKGLTVTRDALFCAGFVADGEIDLADCVIGGNLTCGGGRFTHRPVSLKCDRAQIKQSAQFGDGFYADGTVSLHGVQVTADLEFTRAELAASGQVPALTLRDATVGGTLRMRFVPQPVAAIDLTRAKVGQLDDRETMWPPEVRLDGFVYGTLPADGPPVQARLALLASNPRYVPQIYLQLASVYQAAGSDDESTAVAIAGEDARRRSQTGVAGRFKRALGFLLKLTVQYGYRPLQVLWWLFALEIVGTFVFIDLHGKGLLKPTSGAPEFNSILYTLDLLVPVVSLGQRAFWTANGAAVWVSAVFTITGWILALCLAVGVGRIFKTQ